eukprot:c12692_g1_i1.p3 GENE.c12692_g1_i1~~c12692_g1_i1.p3  ORF type:complete len:172 (-),score=31.52 c12692_g1_i1:318-833(-)
MFFVCIRDFGCSVSEVHDVRALQGMLNAFVRLISWEDVVAQSNPKDFTDASASSADPVTGSTLDIKVTSSAAGDTTNDGDDDMSCIVCFERPIECVLIPCGHSCVCMTCSGVLNSECPVCRNRFKQAIKIFHVHRRKALHAPSPHSFSSRSFSPRAAFSVPTHLPRPKGNS